MNGFAVAIKESKTAIHPIIFKMQFIKLCKLEQICGDNYFSPIFWALV